MPRKAQAKTNAAPSAPVLNPHAAGIDIGATTIYVAVPADRDLEPVRRFGTFTQDLLAMARWLKQCDIRTVAMEATGVYWIPLFQILEERGMEVCLVNARHVKNVPGRKSDVADCQWLRHLHAVGLLRGSFHPPQAVRAVRALLRHRDSLVKMAASHVQHMQKALTQMNLQLHQVISDITGQTGLAILDAILDGERDPEALAQLRHPGIKASKETIVRSMQGDCERNIFSPCARPWEPIAITSNSWPSATGRWSASSKSLTPSWSRILLRPSAQADHLRQSAPVCFPGLGYRVAPDPWS
jgi:hypothetical protein